ncbi:MAG: hypothetical protein ACYC18_04475 [Gammaproteobacteria bacterium]|nr:hypothetical protein [Gammaproteobacteria bacterium]
MAATAAAPADSGVAAPIHRLAPLRFLAGGLLMKCAGGIVVGVFTVESGSGHVGTDLRVFCF